MPASAFALTDYAKNLIVDHIFRTPTMPKPTVLWWALFTTAPNQVAGSGVEVIATSTGYGRILLGPSNASFYSTQGTTSGASNGTTGETSNAGIIQFAAPLLNWGNCVAIGFCDAVTSGNLWAWAPLSPTLQVNAGDLAPAVPIGDLVFRFP